MIYDRTQADVDNAILIRETKVKNFQELTEEEIAILEKGTMTINTINRIDSKQGELKNILNNMGYWNIMMKVYSDWLNTHIFNKSHFQIYIDNTNSLRNAFFTYKDTPNTPPISFHYNDINALEKILHDLESMTNNVISSYSYSGNIICGEE